MRGPAGDAPDRECRREQFRRQAQAVQQQRRVELDVGVEPPIRLALAQQAQRGRLDLSGEIVERRDRRRSRRTAPPPCARTSARGSRTR